MKILDLFSGIGGFSLGLERAGFKTVAFCEIDPFCREVLRKHWPDVSIYHDVCKLNSHDVVKKHKNIDIITGGFPCQDLSIAGKQKGINEGDRSELWWKMQRIISEIRPKFAIMENVPNLLSGERGVWFSALLGSLAEIGYDAEWRCISAGAVGKPHLRERVWIVAYPNDKLRIDAREVFQKIMPENNYIKQSKPPSRGIERAKCCLELLPKHLRVDDGIPLGLDEIKQRIKACGNSIVPEIAYLIGKSIKKITNSL